MRATDDDRPVTGNGPSSSPPTTSPAPTRGREALRHLAELIGLSGLAIAQPVLASFGQSPETFIAQDAAPVDIVVFVVAVVLVPPVLLWAVESLIGVVDRRVGRWVHRCLLGVLAAGWLVVALHRSDVTTPVLVVGAAAAVGVLLAWAYRFRSIRQWLAVLALLPLLFAGVFVWSSPAGELLESVETVAPVPTDAAERSVVMVIFDELPLDALIDGDGAIDAERYPNLAALADDAVWYRNTTTVATVTSAAVPALLTGQYARSGLAPVAADHPENLFTLLAGSHELEVEEQVTSLCPLVLCHPIDQVAGDHNPVGGLLGEAASSWWRFVADPGAAEGRSIEEVVRAIDADDPVEAARLDIVEGGAAPQYRVDAFDDLLASIEAGEDPTLHFLHLQLPHAPYRFLPNGQAYQSFDEDGGLMADAGTRGPDPYETDLARLRLVLQTGYVDELVGELVDRLQETGLYEDTTLVITSDHGVGLEPDQLKRPLFDEPVDPALYPDLLWVPLLIKDPGLPAGVVDDRNAQLIDVLPTMAGLLGLEVPWEVDGIPLNGARRVSGVKLFNRAATATSGDDGFDVALAQRSPVREREYFAAMLERNLDRLLRGTNPDHPLFDITEGGELIGGEVATSLVDRPTGITAELVDPEALQRYGADADYVPVRVRGALRGLESDQQVTVAVAVDGVVAGVGRTTWNPFEPHVLDVLLSPELVRPGDHDVALYLVEPVEGRFSLWPIALS